MSRTNRDFPASFQGDASYTKYGRDGQYSPGISGGWQHGCLSCKCWLCSVVSNPKTKRSVTKLRRAHEKIEARVQVRECLATPQLVSSSVA